MGGTAKTGLMAAALAAAMGAGYWMGARSSANAKPGAEAFPRLQIVQPLTEAQRKLLLEAGSDKLGLSLSVKGAKPGEAPQKFQAAWRATMDTEDAGAPHPTPEPTQPLYNPFPKETPEKPPVMVPYPCKVLDSQGNWVWGVCYKWRFG